MKFINYFKNNIEIILIIILPILFFLKVLIIPNQIIFNSSSDIALYSFMKHFIVNSIASTGEIPLWNNFMFSGTPFVGNPLSAMFYPVNILYLIIPVDKAFGYIFTLDFILLGVFTYFYCRAINLDKFSSLFSSLVNVFGSTFAILSFPGHIHNADAITWFPALLLSFELAIQKNKLYVALISGILLALMIMSGFVQITVFALTASLIYFTLRLLIEYRNSNNISLRILFFPAVAIITGLLLSAIQLLPSIEFAANSTRRLGISYDYASLFTFYPYQIISVILPHFFGSPLDGTWWARGNFWAESAYMGIIPIILAGTSLILIKNKYVKIFFALLIFSLLYSFGNYGFVFPFFYNHIPFFNSFRVPARFLFVYGFSIAILSGFAVNYIFIRKYNFNKKIIKLFNNKITFLVFTGFVLLIVSFIQSQKSYEIFNSFLTAHGLAINIDHIKIYLNIKKDINLLLFFFASLFLIFAFKFKRINNNLIKFLLISLVIIDLGFFEYNFLKTDTLDKSYLRLSVLAEISKDKSKFRIFDLTGNTILFSSKKGIETITGFDATYLHNYRDFLWMVGPHIGSPYESFFQIQKISNLNILRLLNVKYIISDKNIFIEGTKKIYDDNQYKIYLLEKYMSRVLIVPHAIISKNNKSILTSVSNNTFDYTKTVYLEKKINFPLINPKSNGTAYITKFEPNQIVLNTQSSSSGFLLLSEIWYPGWKAYVNDKEVEIFKSDYIFRSIYLAKGKNRVKFVYEPSSFKIGAILSIATILSLLIYFLLNYKNLIRKWIK